MQAYGISCHSTANGQCSSPALVVEVVMMVMGSLANLALGISPALQNSDSPGYYTLRVCVWGAALCDWGSLCSSGWPNLPSLPPFNRTCNMEDSCCLMYDKHQNMSLLFDLQVANTQGTIATVSC